MQADGETWLGTLWENKSSPCLQPYHISLQEFFLKNKQYAFIYFLLIIGTQLPFTKGKLKEKAELSESFVSTLNLDQTLVRILIV